MSDTPASRLAARLQSLWTECLAVLRGEKSEPEFCEKVLAVSKEAIGLFGERRTSGRDWYTICSILQRLKIVATGLDRVKSTYSGIANDSQQRLQSYLSQSSHIIFEDAPQQKLNSCSTDDAELIQPYRDWFISHFDWPYPDHPQRQHLLTLVPSHGRAQLSNWFINSRRRSGWSELAKQHANGIRERFAEFLERLDKGKVSDEAREQVEKCKMHFTDKGKTLIRPGMDEIVGKVSNANDVKPVVKQEGGITEQAASRLKKRPTRASTSSVTSMVPPTRSHMKRSVDKVDAPSIASSSKRSTSGTWSDSSGLSYTTAPASSSATNSSPYSTPGRATRPLPSTSSSSSSRNRTPIVRGHPQSPISPNRSFGRPYSTHPFTSPTQDQPQTFSSLPSPNQSRHSSRSTPTYRAVSSSFNLDQPNFFNLINLGPPPPAAPGPNNPSSSLGLGFGNHQESNEHYTTLGDEAWANYYPWLNNLGI